MDVEFRKYKTSEACKILGLNRSKVQYYYDQGIITPYQDASGRGSQRFFSPKNLVEIMFYSVYGEKIQLKEWRELSKHIEKVIATRNEHESKRLGRKVNFIDPCGYHPPETYLYIAVAMFAVDPKREGMNVIPSGVATILLRGEASDEKTLPLDNRASLLLLNLTVIRALVVQRIKNLT